jgi:hypothetical protein
MISSTVRLLEALKELAPCRILTPDADKLDVVLRALAAC